MRSNKTFWVCPVDWRLIVAVVVWLIVILMMPRVARAQAPDTPSPIAGPPVMGPPTQPASTYTDAQLDQIVAPIALYPDALLAQLLPASTYPLEVIEAQRWLAANPNPAQAAIDAQNWDPSVKALIHYPMVLQKLDGNLDWMQQLGSAFMGQQPDVMRAIQRVRARAQASGALTNTPQELANNDNGNVEIVPANPDVIYVPQYTPVYVGGYWTCGPLISFALPCPVGPWLGYGCDWVNGCVNVWPGHPVGWGRFFGWGGGHVTPWRHDPARAGPNFRRFPGAAPAFRPTGGDERRIGAFGPVRSGETAHRAEARGFQSRQVAPAPRRQETAQRPQPQNRSERSSAFRGSASPRPAQQQSQRGHASMGGGGGRGGGGGAPRGGGGGGRGGGGRH